MGITVWVTRDFAHMSEMAADIAVRKIIGILKDKDEAVLGLATGNSPTGLYKTSPGGQRGQAGRRPHP